MKNLFLFTFFISSCISSDNTLKNSSTWNIIFYVAADNDLNSHGFHTVQTAAEGYLKNSNINVFFMCDGISTEEYDRSENHEAFYYKLNEGSPIRLENKGIINSGSTTSFNNFIDFIFDNYGIADHTALFLWGHGSNIELLGNDHIKDNKGIFLADSSSNDSGFSFNQLISAIKYIYSRMGNKKLDLLGLDACNLMKVEIAYEIKDYANYLIASQIKQNALSWNYKDILNYLSKNSSIDAIQLVNKTFLAYQYFYEFEINSPMYSQSQVTDNRKNDAISVLNLNYIDSFHICFENYIKCLIDILNNSSFEFRKEFIKDFRGEFNNKFTRWTNGKILKGAVIFELSQDIINDIVRGEQEVIKFDESINFIDIKYMIKSIYNWFEERINNYSNRVQNSDRLIEFQKNLRILKPFHDEVYIKFNEVVILNYNREKRESLKGLSIRYSYLKDTKYINYSFGSNKWSEFLKIVNKFYR